MPTWTVECSYAAYVASTQIVEADTEEAACEAAIFAANAAMDWTPLDHIGDTHCDAIARRVHKTAWDHDVGVPYAFSEQALHAAPSISDLLARAQLALAELCDRRIGLVDTDVTTLLVAINAELDRQDIPALAPSTAHTLLPQILAQHAARQGASC